jgi:DNA-directed RNA polymerase specialized sigma24 family protein
MSDLLREAAGGDWDRFFREYLAPCWREIVLACRRRHLPLDDADDLFQELAVRLMREGRSRAGPAPSDPAADPPCGNLAQRYLAHQEAGLPGAKFRTFLKKVVQNLILEHLRQKKRGRPPTLDGSDGPRLEPWAEDSISLSVDRRWVACCLEQAARQLHAESQAARTRGQRRLFLVLYLSMVKRWNAERMAQEFGLDRGTVADLVGRARERFVQIVGQVTGIRNREELLAHVKGEPEALIRALSAAGEERTAK